MALSLGSLLGPLMGAAGSAMAGPIGGQLGGMVGSAMGGAMEDPAERRKQRIKESHDMQTSVPKMPDMSSKIQDRSLPQGNQQAAPPQPAVSPSPNVPPTLFQGQNTRSASQPGQDPEMLRRLLGM